MLQEIDDILAGALTAEDEEAVDIEFAEIMKQNLPDIPVVPNTKEADIELPSVPTEEPKSKREKVKKEAVPLPA